MSHEQIGLCPCPALQDRLNGFFTTCDPTLILSPQEVGLVAFLNSETNTHGAILRKMISPGRGKKRIVELSYTPRILPGEIGTSCADDCAITDTYGLLCETYEIPDTCLSAGLEFILTDLADICEDNETFIEGAILNLMNGILKRLDQEYSTLLSALTGNFAQGETNVVADVKTVQTLQSGGINTDPNGIIDIEFASDNMSYCGGTTYIIGWNEITKYMRRLDLGCCSDGGLDIGDLSRTNSRVYIGDRNVETDLGTNHFYTMAAGAVQPLFWNKFEGARGINVVDTETDKSTVLFHPQFNVPFDFIWHRDCQDIHIQLKLQYDVVGMPSDMFFGGDVLDGVTFVNDYVITNP